MKRPGRLGVSAALSASFLVGCGKGPSVIESAKRDYIDAYGCANEVTIEIGDVKEGATLGGDTLAIAEPGSITLDVEDWSGMNQQEQRNAVEHEMTHACKPKVPKLIEPFTLSDGATVTGVHGLALLITLPNGTQTGFRLIEEGAAEALAYNLDKSYTASSPEYHRLGSLTLSRMAQQGITPQALSGYVQNNDMLGYVSALYGQTITDYSVIEGVMRTYNDA
jgi:hypothetical protein